MIRRLRIKFISITMVLLTALLIVILGLVFHTTATRLEKEALASLNAGGAPLRPGRPGEPILAPIRPVFTLEKNAQGDLIVQGGAYFDLSDMEMVADIFSAAEKDGRQRGELPGYNLRFHRSETPSGVRYTFMDTSEDARTLQELGRNCIFIAIVAMVGFFGISVALARWAIRPVERAWLQQRQFVADASHELKTPLTVILTNTELLRSGEYGEGEKVRFTDSILTMSQQMRLLVESLLNLARADMPQERKEYTRLALSELVENAVLPFEPVYYENGRMLESTIEPELWVKGDERNLKQAVEVLLDNGVKYSDPGSTTSLILMKQGRRLLLTVTTPGQPLTKEQCKDIFKRFYRADTARTRDGSYGLGLPIAQRIVENHGGRIWAQPTAEGNSFTISLPEG